MWNYLLTRYFLGWLWVGLGLFWVEFGLLWVGCSSGDSSDSKIKKFCSLTTASVFELGGRKFAWSPYTWGLRYYSPVLSLEKLEKLDTKISMDLIHNANLKTTLNWKSNYCGGFLLASNYSASGASSPNTYSNRAFKEFLSHMVMHCNCLNNP